MKEKPILVTAIILTILVELTLMFLVYNKIGSERLPVQIGRLVFQLILIIWMLSSNSNTALFILTAYHVITGLLILNSNNSAELFGQILILYHFVIGLLIYFHDWLEHQLKIKKLNDNT